MYVWGKGTSSPNFLDLIKIRKQNVNDVRKWLLKEE